MYHRRTNWRQSESESRRSSFEGQCVEDIVLPEFDDEYFAAPMTRGFRTEDREYRQSYQPVPLRLRQSFSEDHAHAQGRDRDRERMSRRRPRPRPPAPRIGLAFGGRNGAADPSTHSLGHQRSSTETSLSSAHRETETETVGRLYVTPPTASDGGSTAHTNTAREELRLRKACSVSDDILFIARNNRNRYAKKWAMSCNEMNEMSIEEGVIEYHVPSTVSLKETESASKQSGRRSKKQNIKINIHINNDVLNKCRSLALDSVGSSECEGSETEEDERGSESADSGDSVEKDTTRHVIVRPHTTRASMARKGPRKGGRVPSPMRLKGSHSLRTFDSPIAMDKASSLTDLSGFELTRTAKGKKRTKKDKLKRKKARMKVKGRDRVRKEKKEKGKGREKGKKERCKCKHGRKHRKRDERDGQFRATKRECSCDERMRECAVAEKGKAKERKTKTKKTKVRRAKGKSKSKQIKFRRKKFRNPIPPPVAASPRSARLTRENSLKSYDWSGLI